MAGHAGRLARVAWLALVLPAVTLFLVALPLRYAQLTHPPAAIRVSLEHSGLSLELYTTGLFLAEILFVAVYWATAGVIFRRRSADWMALLVGLFLVLLSLDFPPMLQLLAAQQPVAALFSKLIAALTYICLDGLFYLFPNGRFVPRWTWVLLVFVALLEIPFNLPSNSPFSFRHWSPWLLVPIAVAEFVTPVGAQIYRYRRVSNAAQRQQTKWVVYGVSVALVAAIAVRGLLGSPGAEITGFNELGNDPILYAVILLIFLLIPLSFGLAILRSHLWDIDLIINRTLVYAVLTTSIIGLYGLVVVGLGTLLQAQGNILISLLTTGLIAVLFHPLRDRLQSLVNRLMYGERDSPYKVISRLSRRLEATLAPDAVLSTIVATVAQALKLPYVAITLRHDDQYAIAAAYGTAREPLTRLPLVHQAEPVGELLLAPRAPGESFSLADRALLADLARQAGLAVRSVRLTNELQHLAAELQRSRTQLVTAREEERRRLRRDLHDGLGPTLGALTLTVGSARYLYTRGDGAAADALLAKLEQDIAASVAEIRRLVYALRPPVLDEHGLVAAIRECAAPYQPRGNENAAGFTVSIEAPESLGPLPAAVEVAAYRIVQEALTNVARHAQARACIIRLAVSDVLVLEIADDGVGLPAGQRMGVGLLSIRERAAELGGVCETQRLPGGGTRVRVELPLIKEIASPENPGTRAAEQAAPQNRGSSNV